MPGGYDAVVIGAGHNGLTCGCYLAKAGLKVLVLEQSSEVDGMTNSEEIAAPQIEAPQQLGLAAHGLELITPDPNWARVFPDGKSLAIGRDLDTTVKSFAQFSAKDGETWRAHYQSYLVAKPAITAGMTTPPPSLAVEFAGAAEVDHYRFQFQSVRSWEEQTFVSPEVRNFFACCMPASYLTTRSGAEFAWLFACAVQDVGVSVVKGGMNNVSRSLADALRSHGGRCAYALRWPRSNARTAAPRPCGWQAARESRWTASSPQISIQGISRSWPCGRSLSLAPPLAAIRARASPRRLGAMRQP
jgi:beta-carotene ketolase (CrtO type)